jgi:hypothetical protein
VPGAERNAANREEKAAQALSEQELELDELRWLMAAKQGRRFMWRLLERAGIYRVSFTGDALSTAFNEGTKNEGRYLLGLVTKHLPERYLEMLKEARTYERRNASSTG